MRRVTITLMLGLETEADMPLDDIARCAIEEIQFWMPTVGDAVRSARVTRVVLVRSDEQAAA